MFIAGPAHGYRFAGVVILSLALIVLDVRFDRVSFLRQSLSYLISPVQSLVSLPGEVMSWSTETFSERNELLENNRRARSQILILQQKVQQLSVLEAENERLRRLLDATARLETEVMTAELISVDPDPFTIQVIVNRGAQDGVYLGQAVVDAYGLFGVVVQVDSLTSRVALVADVNFAVPVYVNRNGIRSVVTGTGNLDLLEMEYMTNTADVQIGDLLVTSGLGGLFPEGYPVAEVESVEHDPGTAFASIKVKPLAHLGQSRSLLMVFLKESEDE